MMKHKDVYLDITKPRTYTSKVVWCRQFYKNDSYPSGNKGMWVKFILFSNVGDDAFYYVWLQEITDTMCKMGTALTCQLVTLYWQSVLPTDVCRFQVSFTCQAIFFSFFPDLDMLPLVHACCTICLVRNEYGHKSIWIQKCNCIIFYMPTISAMFLLHFKV